MKLFFWTVLRNIIGCFKGRMLLWHVIAIALTFILVVSGFDWHYYLWTHVPRVRSLMFPAVRIGGFLPIVLPFTLLALGIISGNAKVYLTGWAVGQSEVIGALVAASYKAVTGRTHPPRVDGTDMSHVFRLGFLRGGVFWGWPSSHTTIAFSMAVTVFMFFPKQRALGYAALGYGFYVGIGVSMTIHWFSDFVAGAIFGTVIGVVVGRSFLLAQRMGTA